MTIIIAIASDDDVRCMIIVVCEEIWWQRLWGQRSAFNTRPKYVGGTGSNKFWPLLTEENFGAKDKKNKNMKMCVEGKGLLFNFSILWLWWLSLYFGPIQLSFVQKWDAPLFYLSDSSEFLIWAHLQIKLNIQHILHKLDMMMMMIKIVWSLDDNDENWKGEGRWCSLSWLLCVHAEMLISTSGKTVQDQIQIQGEKPQRSNTNTNDTQCTIASSD